MSAPARRPPASEEAPEFRSDERLSPANFKRLAQFIQTYSGIKMPPTKKTMLEGRVRKRVRACGRRDVNDYCRFLFDEDGFDTELVHLIDAVTTNKTEFFREPAHFDVLVREILPKFARQGRRTVRAWSAAASMGAEAYTLAMVLEDFCAERGGMDFSILGTDLCTQVLGLAVRGVYPASMVEPVPADLRQRFVMKSRNPARHEVRIAPRLRAKAAFGRLNLMDEKYPVANDMDLIFCRNILIYFDKPTQAAVLRRLCSHLRPGGYLFLGHSESLMGVELPVKAVASTVFERI